MPTNRTATAHPKRTFPAPSPGFHGRVWVDGPEGTFIGYGRILLLERIIEHGSITKAAKSMQLAYRRAWDLVNSMNKQAKQPFVELASGGKGGGGARVTEEGRRAIAMFWQFQEDLQKFLRAEQSKLRYSTFSKKVINT